MAPRKKPVRHGVSSYNRDNGSNVRSHERGSGIRSQRSSRSVGEVVGPKLKSLLENPSNLEMGSHQDDFVDLMREFGFVVRSPTQVEARVYYTNWTGEEDYFDEYIKPNWDREVYRGIRYNLSGGTPLVLEKGGAPVKVVYLQNV